MTSQSSQCPVLFSRFCNPPEVKFDALVHQNTGKENRYRKFFLLYLSVHWGDLIEQIKKETLIYTLTKSVAMGLI